MSPRANDVLERFRAAEELDARSLERMSEALLQRVSSGRPSALGVDLRPIVLPQPSWSAKLFGSAASKLGFGFIGLIVVTGAISWFWRAEQRATTASLAPASARTAEGSAMDALPAPPSAAALIESSPLLAPPALPNPAATETMHATDRSRRGDPRLSAQPKTRTKPAATPGRHAPRVAGGVKPSAADEASKRGRPASSEPGSDEARTVQGATLRAAPVVAMPSSRAEASAVVKRATPTTRTAPAPMSIHLDAELALLRRAYAELNAGRNEHAFELLDEHAERFPHGELEEAREVARMLALCAMGREPAARVRAQNFLAAHPASAFTGRVRGICPPSSKKTPPR